MNDIPAPLVLDPDRVLRDDRDDMTAEDHRSQAHMLDAALHETADYAKQLWNDLAAMRQYLYDALPAEPADGAAAGGASPVGPDDEQGWSYWCDAYAEVTSVLCGPKGDNGYGRSTATVLAQFRRQPAVSEPARTVEVRTPKAVATTTHSDAANAKDGSSGSYADAAVKQPITRSPDVAALLSPLAYVAVGALSATVASRTRVRRRS